MYGAANSKWRDFVMCWKSILISLMAARPDFIRCSVRPTVRSSLSVRLYVRPIIRTKGNPAYNASKDRRRRTDPDAREGLGEDGIRVNASRLAIVATKMTKGDDGKSEAARGRHRADTAETAGNTGRHGGRRAVPGVAACGLYRRSNLVVTAV